MVSMLAALHFVMVFRIACRASREEQENPRNPFPFFFPFSKWGPVHTPGDPPVGAGGGRWESPPAFIGTQILELP